MNAKHSIYWLEPAKENVRDIVDFLASKAPLVALGFQSDLDNQLKILEDWPRLAQENKYFPELRDFKLKGIRYIVAYYLPPGQNTVEIVAVIRESQDRSDHETYNFFDPESSR